MRRRRWPWTATGSQPRPGGPLAWTRPGSPSRLAPVADNPGATRPAGSGGIPALDEPRFQRARDVDWLSDAKPVPTVTVAGETRGYPIQIMMWHEIVNNTIGGVPVAVAYCVHCATPA